MAYTFLPNESRLSGMNLKAFIFGQVEEPSASQGKALVLKHVPGDMATESCWDRASTWGEAVPEWCSQAAEVTLSSAQLSLFNPRDCDMAKGGSPRGDWVVAYSRDQCGLEFVSCSTPGTEGNLFCSPVYSLMINNECVCCTADRWERLRCCP